MGNVLAVILAGGQGERLSLLSDKRAKPAVPFAGKYRIIDFALSNCVNSGITDVAVLTQYRPHSLHDHIGIGKPWDLDRQKGGVRLLQPLSTRRAAWLTLLPILMPTPMLATESALHHIEPQRCSMHYSAPCVSTRSANAGPVSSGAQWLMTRAGPPALRLIAISTSVYYTCRVHK